MDDNPYVLGIDPGVSGALAWLKDGMFSALADMPVRKTRTGKREVDGVRLLKLLRSVPRPTHILVEKVHAMPPKGGRVAGTQSSFAFGLAAGVVHGELYGLEWPFELVPPQSWKRIWNLIGEPKEAAVDVAVGAFPEFERYSVGPRGGLKVGRADALLIAGTVLV